MTTQQQKNLKKYSSAISEYNMLNSHQQTTTSHGQVLIFKRIYYYSKLVIPKRVSKTTMYDQRIHYNLRIILSYLYHI